MMTTIRAMTSPGVLMFLGGIFLPSRPQNAFLVPTDATSPPQPHLTNRARRQNRPRFHRAPSRRHPP